jgi:hypothetical protein
MRLPAITLSSRMLTRWWVLVYLITLLALLPVRSLWLDEILDLPAVRDLSISGLLRDVPHNAGGVPLSYFSQAVAVRLFGFSAFSGRLPSAVFSVLGCIGMILLARQIGLRYRLVVALVFCTFPLQFRYALEARPYSQALCIGIWLTVLLLQLLQSAKGASQPVLREFHGRSESKWAAAYGLLLAAGLYAQPYTLFVSACHWLWLFLRRRDPEAKALLPLSLAIVFAAISFLPWYLWARVDWRHSAEHGHFSFHFGWKTFALVLREITGAGYVGIALVLLACVVAWRTEVLQKRHRVLLCLYAIVPVIGALCADANFGYFVAIRQMIFVLAPLALLVAAGFEGLALRGQQLGGWLLIALLLVTNVTGDVRYLLRPREDWGAAASQIAKLTTPSPDASTITRGCVIFVPPSSAPFYEFFDRDITRRQCPAELRERDPVVLAISPYEAQPAYDATRKALRLAGFFKRSVSNQNGPRIEIFARRE